MDESGIDPDLWCALAALLGVGLAFERFDYGDIQREAFRWVMLGQLALAAVTEADSVRGFLYLLMMPIGCYKVARILAGQMVGGTIIARSSQRIEADAVAQA